MVYNNFLKKWSLDPFLTHLWSKNGPFSNHIGIFRGPKRVTTGSKWAKTICFSIPNGRYNFCNSTFLIDFSSFLGPMMAPFQDYGVFCVPNVQPRAQIGVKTLV